MSDALRSLLAEFVVQVDKAGELAKGNEAVSSLKARLQELQAEFAKVKAPAARAGRAVQDAFMGGGGFGGAPGLAAAIQNSARERLQGLFGGLGAASGGGRLQELTALSGRDSSDGFLGAGAATGGGIGKQIGPTRDTLNAGRAQMRAAEQAAAAYAQTLRGKLAGAVNAVRAGFNGGGGSGGKGPGLIASLATVRNGLLALGAGAAVRGVKHLVDSIGDISEGSARLGVTTDEFQRLSALAKINATDVGTLGTAFRNLATSAVDPSKETTAAFAQLGVSVKDGAGQFKTSQQLFFETGEALSGVTNETVRTQLAQKLLGRSAIELKPLFAQGTEAFRKQREEMLKLRVLSPQVIEAADGLSDSWTILSTQLLAAAGPVLQDIVFPALKTLTGWLFKGVDILDKWIKRTDFASAGLTALGFVLASRVLPGLQLMIGLGGGVTATLLGMAGAAARSALAFAAWAIPAAIIEDFIGFLRGDESAIGEALDTIFGKGASVGVIEALGKAWDMLASAVKRVLEALHLFKPGDVDLEQRGRADQAFEGSNFQRKVFPSLKVFADALVPGLGSLVGNSAQRIVSATSSAEYGSSMPAPGPLMSGGDATNASLAPNVSIGDSVVNITMGPSASATDVGSAVSSSLDRQRDGVLASYPQ